MATCEIRSVFDLSTLATALIGQNALQVVTAQSFVIQPSTGFT